MELDVERQAAITKHNAEVGKKMVEHAIRLHRFVSEFKPGFPDETNFSWAVSCDGECCLSEFINHGTISIDGLPAEVVERLKTNTWEGASLLGFSVCKDDSLAYDEIELRISTRCVSR